MSNLVFILLAVAIPFLSIGIGMLVFSGLPIGIAVTLTIFVFLLFSYGCYKFSSAWQKKIRGPAKTIEYETILLSKTSDSSGRRGLDIPYIFGLGILGHVASVTAVVGIIFTTSKVELVSILTGKVIVMLGLILLIIRTSKASPFFVPQLIASRDGIRTPKYLIPWQDVINVGISSSKGNPVYVQTTRGISAYRIGGDGQYLPCELKSVELSVLGMWRADAVQYLQIRARLTCEANKMAK